MSHDYEDSRLAEERGMYTIEIQEQLRTTYSEALGIELTLDNLESLRKILFSNYDLGFNHGCMSNFVYTKIDDTEHTLVPMDKLEEI